MALVSVPLHGGTRDERTKVQLAPLLSAAGKDGSFPRIVFNRGI